MDPAQLSPPKAHPGTPQEVTPPAAVPARVWPRIHVAKNAKLSPAQRDVLQRAIHAAFETSFAVAGYPPALAPVSVAQFLLESAWGKSDCGGANNYFGIKARDGEPFVVRRTWEVVGGRRVETTARFRSFISMTECFRAHAQLFFRTRIGRPIYERALAHPTDPIAFARALTGVYATDPEYGSKLCSIMRDRGLLESFGFPA